MIKLTYTLLLAVCFSKVSGQQANNGTANPDFASVLQKIIRTYPANFTSLQGPLLSREGSSTAYASRICFTGAVNCEIRKYTSVKDKSASWTCLLYEGDEFSEAVTVYQNTFSQLRKSAIDIGAGQTLGFSGKMSPPDENLRFTESNLKAECKNGAFLRLVARLELLNNFAGWEVRVNFFSGNNSPDEE